MTPPKKPLSRSHKYLNGLESDLDALILNLKIVSSSKFDAGIDPAVMIKMIEISAELQRAKKKISQCRILIDKEG